MGGSLFLQSLTQVLYSNILFPFIRWFLQLRHENIHSLVLRNSILEKSFHPFFSDIDITLVVKNESLLDEILKDYFRLKKIFIMLDAPEIYTIQEHTYLEELKRSKSWDVIDLIWHFRKLNWCKKSLLLTNDPFEMIKLNRSIQKSLQRLIRIPSETGRYTLQSFYTLDQLFVASPLRKTCCYYSSYLSNDFPGCFNIELSRKQFEFLNSLMPGESIMSEIKNDTTPIYLQSKEALFYHELYLSKSALRVMRHKGLPTEKHKAWIEYLEEKNRSNA